METLRLVLCPFLICALGACATRPAGMRAANSASGKRDAELAQSIRRHDMDIVAKLVSGTNINNELLYQQIWIEPPPLFLAAQTDNREMVEFLLRHGADATVTRSNAKDNALFFSTSPEIMDLLIAHGASMESLDYWGRTPLVSAIEAGWTAEIVRGFIARSANINILNRDTQTALDVVREEKQRLDSIERMLISRGAKTAAEIQK